MRVLKSTAQLFPQKCSTYSVGANGPKSHYNGIYECYLPADYFHMLNCTVEYYVSKTYKCND